MGLDTSNYTVNTETNHERLIVNKPYSIFNIIKNVNGTAHYFFNGFERIQGTHEIVIKLIRANKTFSDSTNIMHDGRRKNIKFTDKYYFVNFNDIKDINEQNQIAEAIKEKDYAAYNEMFKVSPTLYDENFNTSNKIIANLDHTFDYKGIGERLGEILSKFVKHYSKSGIKKDKPLHVKRENNYRIDETGRYDIKYLNSQFDHKAKLTEGDIITLPNGAKHIYVNGKPFSSQDNPIAIGDPPTNNSLAIGTNAHGNNIVTSNGTSEILGGKTITIADHSNSNFNINSNCGSTGIITTTPNGQVLKYDNGETKWVTPELTGMKILSKNSKKKNNKISIEEDELIILK